MTYSSKEIEKAVSTVHMNSRRQAKRNLTTNYTNGDINFIGDCCFAYTGSRDTPASSAQVVELLNFNSGPNFLKINFQPQTYSNTTDNIDFKLTFNGIQVERFYYLQGYNNYQNYPEFTYIVPPFTEVLSTGRNDGSSTAIPIGMAMSGKVYAGAEIIQGAI